MQISPDAGMWNSITRLWNFLNFSFSFHKAGKVNNSPKDLDRKYDTQGGSRIGANAGHLPAAVPSRAEILSQDRGTGNPRMNMRLVHTRALPLAITHAYATHAPKKWRYDYWAIFTESKGNADATRGSPSSSKAYSPSTPKRTSTRSLEDNFQENHGSVYPQAVHAQVILFDRCLMTLFIWYIRLLICLNA